MKLYAAIDLHSTNSYLTVIDEHDTPLIERRFPNDLERLLAALAPLRESLQGIAVESTYNWYWLVDGLQDAGYRVRLVNTAAVAQYDGLKHGDDRSDARWLARLLRLGVLPEGFIFPREQRATRDLLRRRSLLVRQRVQLMLSLESTLSRRTGKTWSTRAVTQLDEAAVEKLLPETTERFGFLIQFALYGSLQQQIDQIEQWLRVDCRADPALVNLKSISGVGDILGMTILLETGPVDRFASVGDYASYCRMVESVRFSNGKLKGRGNAKCGNRYLCWAFVEAANFAIRFNPAIAAWYQRKRSRKHRIVAIKAVAHKLARAAYYILRDRTAFDTARAFG